MEKLVPGNTMSWKWGGYVAYVLLLILFGVTAWIYSSGLHGAFLLDDYQNLKGLAYLGHDLSWREWLTYAETDVSGPLGRPVSMFSFVLQREAWPEHPHAFKLVNLLIHILTGGGLFFLFHRLASLRGLVSTRAYAVALMATALWLLAPLQVSTVLYTVQRMTQLSALFSVIGMLLWLHGRVHLAHNHRLGWVWVTLGLGMGLLLAILSKENGVLLPMYILVMDRILLANLPQPKAWRVWRGIFLWGPLVCAVGWLALRYGSVIAPGYAVRDFSLGERLLTEPRVLFDYLRMAVAPNPSHLGLFHDDYEVSRGLSSPVTTSLALLFFVAMLGGAWGVRYRCPALTFGLFWFFGGHLLEGSVIPLELYFEHRNYLPLAGVYLTLALLVEQVHGLMAVSRWQVLMVSLPVMLIGFFMFVTVGECRLWGDPELQAEIWGREHPHSLRAQETLGNMKASKGEYRQAAKIYAKLVQSGNGYAYILWWQTGCFDPEVALPGADKVANELAMAPFSVAPLASLEQLVRVREDGLCGRLKNGDVEKVFSALLGNPNFISRRDMLDGLLVRWRRANVNRPGTESPRNL